MGFLLFLTGAAAEAVFTAFCIITKSRQEKASMMIRLGAIAVFLAFIFLNVIEWSFRFYAPAALLALLTALGAVSLFRKKTFRRPYKTGRAVVRGIAMMLLIFVSALPAIIFPHHKPLSPTGAFKVVTALRSYTDDSRIETYTDTGESRKLNVQFWYPADTEKPCPLVIFSHGSLGIKTSNESLFYELASHGYVVCSIDHTYQCFFTTDGNGHTSLLKPEFFRELSTELNSSDKQLSYDCYQKWMNIRMGDIHYVIDRILAEADVKGGDDVYRLVDQTKIGVMGHSLGGSAALGIGRVRSDVQAVIALEAPFMYDIKGVQNDSFVFTDEAYPVPLLNIYSDDSWDNLTKWPAYYQNSRLLDANDSYSVHISGVGHLSLTDLSLSSPILTDLLNGHRSSTDPVSCLRIINKACLSFFDYSLKGAGAFVTGTY